MDKTLNMNPDLIQLSFQFEVDWELSRTLVTWTVCQQTGNDGFTVVYLTKPALLEITTNGTIAYTLGSTGEPVGKC